MSTYDDAATALLKEMGVTFEVRHVGNGCPRFCKDLDDMSEAGKFPRKKHIHGDQHLCVLRRAGGAGDHGIFPPKTVGFDFWNSYRDQEIAWAIANPGRAQAAHKQPWPFQDAPSGVYHAIRTWVTKNQFSPLPTAHSLLACLQKSDVGTFKDFCSDFGYSDDSIRAIETYQAVQEEFEKVRRFFTAAELEQLQDIT